VADSNDDILLEARARYRVASDAVSDSRAKAGEDLKFGNGEQWPNQYVTDRDLEGRPCLTINHTDTYVRRVVNKLKQQLPRINVHPVGDGADVKTAEVINGLTRHIEANSNAPVCYGTAVDYAARCGEGYWRVLTDYEDEKSFNQEIRLAPIFNPFSVLLDPASEMPDGSDSQWGFIIDSMRRDDFTRMYPNAQLLQYSADNPVWMADWETKTQIRVAEYYRLHMVRDTLVMLSDGRTMFKSQLADLETLTTAGLMINAERPTFRKQLQWFKLSGAAVLAKRDLPGKYVPIIPVYGRSININGKLDRKGMIRDLKDPARMYNYWRTAETERLALTPKAPWVMAEGQADGHEDQWDNANRKAYSRLEYKPVVGPDGQMIPPPMRQPPAEVPAGFVQAAQGAEHDLLVVAGMEADPNQDSPGKIISGVAIGRREDMSDVSHYDLKDNLTISLKHCGRVILDLVPPTYDTQRIQRIIGDDGQPDTVTLNEKVTDPVTKAVLSVKNNMQVGKFDVVMDTTPGYLTKRQEAADSMIAMLNTPLGEKLANTADDLVLRNMDWPGAQEMADRLASMNPLSQVDKKADVPPAAQMLIMSLKKQLQDAQQQSMAFELELKTRGGIAHEKNQTDLQIARMKTASEDKNSQRDFEGWKHEVEVNSVTKRDVAEIGAAASLMNTHVEAAHNKAQADAMINKGLKDG
jgi:hypothetical protein